MERIGNDKGILKFFLLQRLIVDAIPQEFLKELQYCVIHMGTFVDVEPNSTRLFISYGKHSDKTDN